MLAGQPRGRGWAPERIVEGGAGVRRCVGGACQAVNPFYHRIYRVVRHIPRGRVATYGVVARLAGRPGAARTVGWALSALPEDTDVPWWRVINAAGRISLSSDHSAVLQRALLLREGVRFAPGGAVNLSALGWPVEAYDSVAAQSRAASSRRSRRLNGFRT